MLLALRQVVAKRVAVVFEALGFLASLSGATFAIFLGKLFLAAVLAALTLGFFLRLTGRRSKAVEPQPPTPVWVFLLSAALSVIEVGVLAESTNLPVRFDQAGFRMEHWLLALAALLVAFFVQVQLFRVVFAKHHAEEAP